MLFGRVQYFLEAPPTNLHPDFSTEAAESRKAEMLLTKNKEPPELFGGAWAVKLKLVLIACAIWAHDHARLFGVRILRRGVPDSGVNETVTGIRSKQQDLQWMLDGVHAIVDAHEPASGLLNRGGRIEISRNPTYER